MKPIERSEVLGFGDYEPIRERFRARVLEQKQKRRVAIGDRMSALFENRDTVLLQIQEMLRTERISEDKAIQHEIETYNELIPGDAQLSFTLFVEVDDREERERMLVACAGMEKAVYLGIDGERFFATITSRAGLSESRTTAVQYYLVDLSEEAARRLRDGEAKHVALGVDHPAYRQEAKLSAETVVQLAGDLAWSG
jgi:hypothetical protein